MFRQIFLLELVLVSILFLGDRLTGLVCSDFRWGSKGDLIFPAHSRALPSGVASRTAHVLDLVSLRSKRVWGTVSARTLE